MLPCSNGILKPPKMQRSTLRCAALLLVLACASLARAESAQSSAKSQLEQMAHAAEPTTGDEICRGSCDPCTVDEDCNPNHFCYTTVGTFKSYCKSYVFFSHTSWRHVVAPLLIFLTATLAAGSGGTGAGTVNVPVLLLVQALVPAEAVSTSQAAIIGGSIAGMFMFGPRSHPNDPTRSIFDVDVVLLLLPTMLCGVMFGVLFNIASPYWFVFTLLILISLWGCWKTVTKAQVLWRRETEAKEAAARTEQEALLTASGGASLAGEGSSSSSSSKAASTIEASQLSSAGPEQGQLQVTSSGYSSFAAPQHSEEESKAVEPIKPAPPSQGLAWKLSAAVLLFLVVATLNLLRGGKPNAKSLADIAFCSTEYWIFTFVQAPALIAISVFVGIHLVRQHERNKVLGRHRDDVDLEWSVQRVIWYPVMAFFAGVFASMIGFGGGLLLSPIMLDLNMPPETVAATSSLIHLMSASAAVINYSIAGMLLWQHALIFAAVALIGQFVGQTIVDYYVRKYRRPSIIAICICVMVLLASLMLVASGAIQVRKDIITRQHLEFKSFC